MLIVTHRINRSIQCTLFIITLLICAEGVIQIISLGDIIIQRDHVTHRQKGVILQGVHGVTGVAWGWIKEPSSGDEELPLVRLIFEGSRYVFVNQRYEIQARYRSWTAYWRRARPKGFEEDEGIGLVTKDEIQSLISQVLKLGFSDGIAQKAHWIPIQNSAHLSQGQSPQKNNRTDTKKVTVRATLMIQAPPWKELSPLLAQLSNTRDTRDTRGVAQPSNKLWRDRVKSGQRGWIQWVFDQPFSTLDPRPEQILTMITSFIHEVADDRLVIDRLLNSDERGWLNLTVSRPAHLKVNGVLFGPWPQVESIPLPVGKHTLTLNPIDQPDESFVYKNIEIERKKTTRLKLILQ